MHHYELLDIKPWTRFLLLFKHSYTSFVREKGQAFLVTKKRLFNVTYILNIEQI